MNPKLKAFIERVCQSAECSAKIGPSDFNKAQWEAIRAIGREPNGYVNHLLRGVRMGNIGHIPHAERVPDIQNPASNAVRVVFHKAGKPIGRTKIENVAAEMGVKVSAEFPDFYCVDPVDFGKVPAKKITRKNKDNEDNPK